MKHSIFFSIGFLFLFILSGCSSSQDFSPLALGPEGASVLIEEFSDVQCPACGVISPQVEELARNNPDLVRLEFYHFPLSYHEFAFQGAMGVECARDQGKGWEYMGILFANQDSLSDSFFYNTALGLNLDMDRFKACLDSDEKRPAVQKGLAEGKKRQIPGTPSIFINGEQVNWGGYEKMEAYIKGL
jgi:protein-disulfide isomerase